MDACFIPFDHSISDIQLPEFFTNPFHYSPHPLCLLAAKKVQNYLIQQDDWQTELTQGKMFGVLIVRNSQNQIGFLTAFSGNLMGSNQHKYFVPPVYDLLQKDGFFQIEESSINSINQKIRELEESNNYIENCRQLERIHLEAVESLKKAKTIMTASKIERDKKREHTNDPEELESFIKESQFQKAEYKRLGQYWKKKEAIIQNVILSYKRHIDQLKTERKQRSAALQIKLFKQFKMLNALGEEKDLVEIFSSTPQQIPPAGAGECAAPKLLQYAYSQHYVPIAMAEFWWGNSPKTTIRHQGYFYPSCKGKCAPILKHMLQGLSVEPVPSLDAFSKGHPLDIVYEDDWLLVVNKPAGQLSVPGKIENLSIEEQLKERYPLLTSPILVHRLDMNTSGLLLAAKTKQVHQNLQAQFKNRTIKKRYTALLDGIITTKQGIINLPLCPDPEDRPRQMVNFQLGKPAITKYKVENCFKNQTRISFFPITGRTHQIRVHAAHQDGLNCPIIGDELYGRKADRLYLHSASLTFFHPITHQEITITKEADF